MQHSVEIRREDHRIYAVLTVKTDKGEEIEFKERVGLQLDGISKERAKAILGPVTDRLIKKAGIRKVKTLTPKNASQSPGVNAG